MSQHRHGFAVDGLAVGADGARVVRADGDAARFGLLACAVAIILAGTAPAGAGQGEEQIEQGVEDGDLVQVLDQRGAQHRPHGLAIGQRRAQQAVHGVDRFRWRDADAIPLQQTDETGDGRVHQAAPPVSPSTRSRSVPK